LGIYCRQGVMQRIVWNLIALTVVLIVLGCGDGDSADGNGGENGATVTSGIIYGIGPVWRHYLNGTGDDIGDMMRKLPEAGGMVLAQNNWRDSIALSGQVPDYFFQLLKNWPAYFNIQYGQVSVGINFFNQATGVPDLDTGDGFPNNWTNPVAREKFRAVALGLCRDYHVRYLALGLEVNTYYWLGHQEDYARFVEFYKSLYDDIKAQYPQTRVFVTFQLEHMKGIGDSSWGYDVAEHWDFLVPYDGRLDIVAFTSYPEFEYDSPSRVPDEYYAEIIGKLPVNLKGKPLAFVEIGWSDRVSQMTQVDFLRRFIQRIDGLPVEYVNWVFMHDDSPMPINPKLNLGLRTYDGAEKLIWREWVELVRR